MPNSLSHCYAVVCMSLNSTEGDFYHSCWSDPGSVPEDRGMCLGKDTGDNKGATVVPRLWLHGTAGVHAPWRLSGY